MSKRTEVEVPPPPARSDLPFFLPPMLLPSAAQVHRGPLQYSFPHARDDDYSPPGTPLRSIGGTPPGASC